MRRFKPKTCAVCGEEFQPRSGAAKYCDACKVAAYRMNSHRYYLEHRREIRLRCAEYNFHYYQEHRDERIAYQRRYYFEHRDKYIAYQREYRKI